MAKEPKITQVSSLLNSLFNQGAGPDAVIAAADPLPLVSPGLTALVGGLDPVLNTLAVSEFGGSAAGPGPGPDPGDAAVVGTAVVGTDVAG